MSARNKTSGSTDPRVDAYIEALPAWQQAICRQVRELVHAADPNVLETIKRTRQPYFTLEGNVCALLAAKAWVNVFLYDGGIVPDPHGIITGGHDNKTARTVATRRGEKVNAPALEAMLKQIIVNNKAGGWRKRKSRVSFVVGDCVRVPDGRVGRVRSVGATQYRIRVQRRTSKTHQFLFLHTRELTRVECPKGWMSPAGYRRYLKATLAKARERQGTQRKRRS